MKKSCSDITISQKSIILGYSKNGHRNVIFGVFALRIRWKVAPIQIKQTKWYFFMWRKENIFSCIERQSEVIDQKAEEKLENQEKIDQKRKKWSIHGKKSQARAPHFVSRLPPTIWAFIAISHNSSKFKSPVFDQRATIISTNFGVSSP